MRFSALNDLRIGPKGEQSEYPLFSLMNTVLIAIKRIWMTSSQELSDTV